MKAGKTPTTHVGLPDGFEAVPKVVFPPLQMSSQTLFWLSGCLATPYLLLCCLVGFDNRRFSSLSQVSPSFISLLSGLVLVHRIHFSLVAAKASIVQLLISAFATRLLALQGTILLSKPTIKALS